MATRVRTKSTTKTRSLTAKQETEKELLETKIEHNKERLASGLSGNGIPLTPNQIETTLQIITSQREKLREIEAITNPQA